MKILSVLTLTLLLAGCDFLPAKETSSPTIEVSETTAQLEATPIDKVEVIKFFDYACGHCRTAHKTVKNLEAELGEKESFVLKHYPLSPVTYLVAETAECARRQDKFEVYHNALFEENFQNYAPENLQSVAESVGLDMEVFNTCVANGGGRSAVQADVDEATAMGVKSTPYFLINNSIPLPGAIPEKSFKRLINQVLAGEVQ